VINPIYNFQTNLLKFILIIYTYARALVEKPEGRRPLGKPRRRWKVNIKMDL
jgi:hypothetical protein